MRCCFKLSVSNYLFEACEYKRVNIKQINLNYLNYLFEACEYKRVNIKQINLNYSQQIN